MIKKTCGPFMRRGTEEEKGEYIMRIRMKIGLGVRRRPEGEK